MLVCGRSTPLTGANADSLIPHVHSQTISHVQSTCSTWEATLGRDGPRAQLVAAVQEQERKKRHPMERRTQNFCFEN